MVVEALFWFHPLVWWIGARLVDERERACDEEVVRLGTDPDVYAESILKTCHFFVESPLTCVPGVTGSNLKKRIERIMSHSPGARLSWWAKALLTALAVTTIAAPVGIGALTSPVRPVTVDRAVDGHGRSFEVTSVLRNNTGADRVLMRVQPGGAWEATNVTLESMIRLAYRIQESQLVGGPGWIHNDRFDIVAKSAQNAPPAEFALRMQSLLTERFKLTLHHETRELSVYALVSNGTPGPRLAAASIDCAALARGRNGQPPSRPGERPVCGLTVMPGRLTGGGISMSQLAETLARVTGRMVVDRTGLAGGFDFELEFDGDPAAVSILPALEQQLGLRLDSRRAPVDVLVIDSAEPPHESETRQNDPRKRESSGSLE
jgi:uncharacterized protein (TIGR03435 family)